MVGCSQQSPDLWRKIWRSCKPVSLPLGAADGNSMQDSGQILECLTFPEQQLAPSCTRYQRCQSWQSRAHPDRQWRCLHKNHRSICTCFTTHFTASERSSRPRMSTNVITAQSTVWTKMQPASSSTAIGHIVGVHLPPPPPLYPSSWHPSIRCLWSLCLLDDSSVRMRMFMCFAMYIV